MLFILLAAWLNPYIHRTKPWYSMCITFGVFPIFYLINAFDQFQLEKNPTFGMCQFQASLIYAGPPATAAAVLCYVLDMALGLYTTLFNRTRNTRWAFRLLYIPSVVFFVVFCISFMTITRTEDVVFEASHMFCTAGKKSINEDLSAGFIGVVLLAMIGIKIWIIIMLATHWSVFRSIGAANRDLRLSVFIRFAIFSAAIWVAGGLSATIILTSTDTGPIYNILLVTVPFIGGLAFGTHKEIAKTWLCWIRRRPLSSIEPVGFYLPSTTTGKYEEEDLHQARILACLKEENSTTPAPNR
ncbi:hypothetical protein BDZ89DRAFT_1059568 [Hymenopellis radicata]|nr:hypothetical protein BDZ89DRAFT_1059568 [Hymenopellis radicata]